MAFAEDKAVQKRGLLDLGYGGYGHGGYGGYGHGLGGGLLGDFGGHGHVAVAIQEKAVAVPVAVPRPYPVAVDRPVPVKVRKVRVKLTSSALLPNPARSINSQLHFLLSTLSVPRSTRFP